jgi:hypothetical protein
MGGADQVFSTNQLTGQVTPGQSFARSQSPDSVASNATAMRGQNMTDARSREATAATMSKPFEVTGPDGQPMLVQQDRSGKITPVQGFGPKAGAAGKLTEDQGKATGWLVQADNAFANMRAALDPAKGGSPNAAYPGVNDAIAAIPSFGLGGVVANNMRSGPRQRFMQSSSSLSEALLRAATGAGVNRDEAEQKVKELTPVSGEDAGTTAQKMAAIPLYLESLKVRAGPGAAQLPGIRARATPTAAAGDVPADIAAILSKHGGGK